MPSAAQVSKIITDGLYLVIASRPVELIRRLSFVSREAQHKKLFRQCGGLQNNGIKGNRRNQSATNFSSTFQ